MQKIWRIALKKKGYIGSLKFRCYNLQYVPSLNGPGSSVGIATELRPGRSEDQMFCFETWWSAVVFTQGMSLPSSYP